MINFTAPSLRRIYVLQGSTDFLNWTPLETNLSPFTFTETNFNTYPYRFYRGKYQP